METDKNSFQKILGSTALFGGVQIFNILFSVIKTKAIAILIGANGLGIIGLFTSTINLLVMFTSVGLDKSAVKEISELNNEENEYKMSKTIYVLNKIILFTGVAGALLTMLLSKTLSVFTFGNDSYTVAFVWLSIAVLINQLTNGRKAILQGTQKLRKLAKANLIGSLIGLVVSLPLYYFFKLDGIIPSIIFTFLAIYIVFLYFSFRSQKLKFSIGFKDTFKSSKPMLSLGLAMSFTSMIHALALWLIQIFVRDYSSLEEVGYYNAGMIIINSYVGMVFTAMGTDYFPRLSAINKNNRLIKEVVNKQAIVAVLLITPIIIFFLTFDYLIINILYTKDFLVIIGLVTAGVIGTLFKAVSFSLGYVIFAKGDSKVFIITAILFNLLLYVICIYGYNHGGLTGLGVGLIIYYFIHLVIIKLIVFYKYNVNLNSAFYKVFLMCVGICGAGYLGTLIENTFARFFVMISILLFSSIFTYKEFNKYLNLKEVFMKFFRQKK